MLYSVLYKKRKFLFALFFKKKSVVEQYKYNGRNDIKLLRGANLMLLITVIFILVYTTLQLFHKKNIVQDFLMYNEFDPKHYKGK